jgi:hypothetical protein
MPNLNPAAITTLVDRSRPKTHTLHLRIGEMTMTHRYVSMILDLPIYGHLVCFSTYSAGCRGLMLSLIGAVPPPKEDLTKQRVPPAARIIGSLSALGFTVVLLVQVVPDTPF